MLNFTKEKLLALLKLRTTWTVIGAFVGQAVPFTNLFDAVKALAGF